MSLDVSRKQRGAFNLTSELMLDELLEYCSLYPVTDDRAAVIFLLAQRIIINSLGREFWIRECTSSSMPQAFLRDRPQTRLTHIAMMLWQVKDTPGFAAWIKRAQNAEFEAAYFELYWLSRFAELFHNVEFNVASLKKGADFDLRLFDGLGYERLNVEVKIRKRPLYTGKAVKRLLGAAREQLPKGEQGAIVLKLATGDGISQAEIDAACVAFLSGTSRVEFIGYCFEPDTDPLVLRFGHCCVTKSGRNDQLIPIDARIEGPPNFMRDIQIVWSALLTPGIA